MEHSELGHGLAPELQKSSSLPNPPRPSQSSRHDIWQTFEDQGSPAPFIGRLGGNQRFVLDRTDPQNEAFLEEAPDAAPHMTLREQLDLRPFRNLGLWKTAVIEGVGEWRLQAQVC